jgi:DNA-binding beta-propeller fold protein YncE
VGTGVQTFQTVPNWASIPDQITLGPTHGGVVIDKKGVIYVSTDSPKGIYVFSADGAVLRTMAPEFSGTHGMCIREENGEEFIYAAHLKGAQIVKMTLEGKAVLTIPYPKEPGVYPEGKGYKPTGVAVAPNGDIFAADGYGTSLIHKFDSTGKYLKTFGGKGTEDGKFQACHGITLDTRSGTPLLLVCDRENRRLQHLDLDGNFVAVITTGLRRPCAASISGDNVAIAELEGRVAILDKTNTVISVLGDNPDKAQWAKFDVAPDFWHTGIFTAPHGISYDAQGNLYVQDWNKTGRVTKLIKTPGATAAK